MIAYPRHLGVRSTKHPSTRVFCGVITDTIGPRAQGPTERAGTLAAGPAEAEGVVLERYERIRAIAVFLLFFFVLALEMVVIRVFCSVVWS